MKYLIAGLGNIGSEYDFTRHNIGFSIVEYMAQGHDAAFSSDRLAHVCRLKIKGRQVTLIKPTTYMNLSGKAIQYWLRELKIQNENLLVITDDLSLPPGKIRMRGAGSAGGHNGLTNIIEVLGTDVFPRLRFGIGNNYPKGMQVQYVLGRWYKEEEAMLAERIPLAKEAVEHFVFQGLNAAMNIYNSR